MSNPRLGEMVEGVLGKVKIRTYDGNFFIEMNEDEMNTYVFARPWPSRFKCNFNNTRAIVQKIKEDYPKARFIPYKEKLVIKQLLNVLRHIQKSYNLDDPIIKEAVRKAEIHITK